MLGCNANNDIISMQSYYKIRLVGLTVLLNGTNIPLEKFQDILPLRQCLIRCDESAVSRGWWAFIWIYVKTYCKTWHSKGLRKFSSCRQAVNIIGIHFTFGRAIWFHYVWVVRATGDNCPIVVTHVFIENNPCL